jgi:WD40 repeat protein
VKIDFARTERELLGLVNDRLAYFASKHPDVKLESLGLWGLSFPPVAKLLLKTSDDDAVFGHGEDAGYEYVANEHGGIRFDWWPDLYDLKDGDHYEIVHEGDWAIDPALLRGDDAINVPLFWLLKAVLEQVSLKGVKRTKDFQLSAQIGAHWLEVQWRPGDAPETSQLINYLESERQAREAGLRPKLRRTKEPFKCRLVTIDVGFATINSLAFMPDGKKLVSFGADGFLRVWNAKTAALFHETDYGLSMALSADGKLAVAFGFQESIELWNLSSGRVVAEFEAGHGPIVSVALAPNGKYLASATMNGTIVLWSVSTAKPISTLADNLKIIGQMAFSPDSTLLAWTCNGEDRSVVLWNVENESGMPVPVKHEPWPVSVTFSPDGKLLATGSADRINIWSISNNRVEKTFELKSDVANCIAFSLDGSILAGGGEDRAFVLWDVATGQKLRTVANPGKHHTVRCLAFAPNGSVLASANSDGTIELWDMKCLTRTDGSKSSAGKRRPTKR